MTAEKYGVSFEAVDWESAAPGHRSKTIQRNNRRYRLVTLDRPEYIPEVCLVGHLGFVVEGEIRIEMGDNSVSLKAGDGLDIPDDVPHTPFPITNAVTLYMVELLD